MLAVLSPVPDTHPCIARLKTSPATVNTAGIDNVRTAANRFHLATQKFMAKVSSLNETVSELQLRMVNDQMQDLGKIFLMPTGLPGRRWVNND